MRTGYGSRRTGLGMGGGGAQLGLICKEPGYGSQQDWVTVAISLL